LQGNYGHYFSEKAIYSILAPLFGNQPFNVLASHHVTHFNDLSVSANIGLIHTFHYFKQFISQKNKGDRCDACRVGHTNFLPMNQHA
jgi:hypothetical protein